MMLCIDGSEISALVLALGSREGDDLVVHQEKDFSRVLGDELSIVQQFLVAAGKDLSDILEIGVVQEGRSVGALRSAVSFVDAFAIGSAMQVYALQRQEGVWTIIDGPRPYVLPLYDRPAHTTPSHKDALGRSGLKL
ncbi:hypothetical protein EBT31_09510 [bacterium]|nr:hypothetical protein [bacterium]NBX49742.1 hypothetical protein [bacterium]